ncbi:MAG: hypothetical protein ACI4M3_02350 [Acutalibacteraceae bacterium]
MSKKKKLSILVVSLLIVISICMGIVLAFLIQNTEKRVNIFTFGNANIDLTEKEWDKLTREERIVYPGKEVTKDPKVKNTGATNIYAYIEIKIPCATVHTVDTDEDGKEIIKEATHSELFSYNVNSGWELIKQQEDNNNKIYVYAYTEKVLAPNEETNNLFDKVKFLNIVEGQLEKDTELDISVSAYAIQSDYLNETGDTLKEKMTDAYSKIK